VRQDPLSHFHSQENGELERLLFGLPLVQGEQPFPGFAQQWNRNAR
jgi:hypothetical protein